MIAGIEEVVRDLGRQLLEIRARGGTSWRREGMRYFADADQQAHEFLTRRLEDLSPGTPVISEEDPRSMVTERPSLYWLIDPIDGTGSFVEGYPSFVTQVALMDSFGPIQAWVYAPATDELFRATRGGGATKNGKALRTNETGSPTTVIDNTSHATGVAAAVAKALSLGNYVESGSIGLKICRVADGIAHLFVKDLVVYEWDLAPGHLVLVESGGCLADVDGVPISYGGAFARNGLVATQTKELFLRFVAWRNIVALPGGEPPNANVPSAR